MLVISRRKLFGVGAGLLAPREMLHRYFPVRDVQGPPPTQQPRVQVGVNVAGAEFGDLAGRQNYQYVYADDAFITWCLDQGFSLIRLPFKWARLMASAEQAVLRDADFDQMRRIARLCTQRGAICWLDMHDFGRYHGIVLGDQALPPDFFATTWRLIAAGLTRERVWFGLMNEPHDQDMDQAMTHFQAAAAAIRASGHDGRILVPSGRWSGAHSFADADNVARFKNLSIEGEWSIDLHQYLDHDNSGTHHAEHVPGKGGRVLGSCTAALRANKWTAVLGEYAWSDTASGNREGDDLIASVHAAPDVWIGHAYWASGPWWKDYPYAIGPANSNGQLAVLKRYM